MKRRTARLLREVLRLIEEDVTACRDAVVEIDEREAKHERLNVNYARTVDKRIAQLEVRVDSLSLLARDTGKRTTTLETAVVPLCESSGCSIRHPHRHMPEGVLYV